MKKYILSMGMIMAVFAFIAMLPLKASAAVSAINATESEEGKASVKLTLPNAAQEGITTVSISLSLDLKDTAGSADGIVPGVEFTEWILGNTKVHTFRSDQGRILNIYIAGTTPLFTADEDGDFLDVGTVYVKRADGSLIPFTVNIDESQLKVVRGNTTALVTEADLLGYGSESDSPSKPSEGNPPGGTPEIDAIRAELKALIEKAETIPADQRTEDLQRAIDEAKRVLEDPNATLEELQAALMNLENALALFDSNQNTGSNSTNTGKDVITEDRKQNGTRVQGVKTGDMNPAVTYATAAALCMAVFGVNVLRRRRRQ